MAHYDVCVIGHVARDVNTVGAQERPPQPGGTAFYASMVYRRLGLRTAAVTSVAPGDEWLLADLRGSGVDVRNRPGASTTVFHNDYARDNPDVRTQRVPAVAEPLRLEADERLPGAAIYHLGPLVAGDIDVSVARACAGAGAMVAVDAQGWVRRVADGAVVSARADDADALLGYVNVLKADLEEMLVLTGAGDLTAAVERLATRELEEVVVTMASRGSIVLGRGRIVGFDAVPPRAVRDATGCGDTYLAAYMQRRREGAGLEACAAYASAAASLNIESHGPLAAASEEVERRWRDHAEMGGAQLRIPDGVRLAFGLDDRP